MLADFNTSSVVEEATYQNGQQSLSSLTDFSGWSLGLNEAKAGCGDNNSCNENYDTMVIIGAPIDDGWGDWDWEWNLGDLWNELMDDFWDDYWDNHLDGNDFVNLDHCKAQVSNVSTACYNTAGGSIAIGVTGCLAYAAALGPVGIGICSVAGIVATGSTVAFCSSLVEEATDRCHEQYSTSAGSGNSESNIGGSASSGGNTGGSSGNYSGGGSYSGGSGGYSDGEFDWAIP